MSSIFFKKRERCEVCGTEDNGTLFKTSFASPKLQRYILENYSKLPKDFFDDECYEVVKCHKCGFLWQKNVLNEKGADILYNAYKRAELKIKKKASLETRKIYMGQIRNLLKLVGKEPTETKVLDFGMGWGFWCLIAKEMGCKSYGFEVSGRYKRFASERGVKVLKREEIGEEGPFDIINIEQVLEHLSNPREILYLLSKSLAKGGILVVGVPSGEGMENSLKDSNYEIKKDSLAPLQHVNCFTNASLLELASLVGLVRANLPLPMKIRNFVRDALRHAPINRNLGLRIYFTRA